MAIAGAGAVGRSLARELIDNGHKVLLIERSSARYRPDTVPKAEWLLADAVDMCCMQEAELHNCDTVIAATGDDQVNLAACLLAKTEFAVPQTVARVNDADNEWLFTEAWGVDIAVSTPRAMVAAVEGAIGVDHLQLLRLRRGRADVAKLALSEGNSLIGQRISNAALSESALVVAVVRSGGRVIMAPSDELLAPDDEILFVTPTEPRDLHSSNAQARLGDS